MKNRGKEKLKNKQQQKDCKSIIFTTKYYFVCLKLNSYF